MAHRWVLFVGFLISTSTVLAAPTDSSPNSTPTAAPGATGSLVLNSTGKVGWTPEKGGRGTFSLVVSCLVIIIASTWVTIHAGVPPSGLNWQRVLVRKTGIFFLNIFTPELACALSSSQLFDMYQMVKVVKAYPNTESFTVVHAFFICMGGLRTREPGLDNKAIVVQPDFFIELIRKGLVIWDDDKRETPKVPVWAISEESIRDRSKADGLAKLLTLVQVCWFLAQCRARWANHLPVSELEVVTLAYVFCASVTYVSWWNKPQDIRVPTFRELPSLTDSQREILTRRDRIMSMLWEYSVIQVEDVHLYSRNVFLSMTAAFGAIHLISWNSAFPSSAELLLWRSAACVATGLPLVWLLQPTWKRLGDTFELIFATSCFFLYILARASLVVEVFVALRSQPITLYDTVPFTNYIFHFR